MNWKEIGCGVDGSARWAFAPDPDASELWRVITFRFRLQIKSSDQFTTKICSRCSDIVITSTMQHIRVMETQTNIQAALRLRNDINASVGAIRMWPIQSVCWTSKCKWFLFSIQFSADEKQLDCWQKTPTMWDANGAIL